MVCTCCVVITVCGLYCLQVGNLPNWVRQCRIFNKQLVGQGFGGIGVCLPLAGPISNLGCDKVGIRARFRGR